MADGSIPGEASFAPMPQIAAAPGSAPSLKQSTAQQSTAAPARSDAPSVAAGWPEMLAIILLVVGADVMIYRGHGFAGVAAFAVAAPLLLLLGAPQRRWSMPLLITAAMILVLAIRLLWLGTAVGTAVGAALIVTFAMSLAGRTPYVLDIVLYGLQTVAAGFEALPRYWKSARHLGFPVTRGWWLRFGLPATVVLGFGTVFVLANPDVAVAFRDRIEQIGDFLDRHVFQQAPPPQEIAFWGVVAWIAIGLLRPILPQMSRPRDAAPYVLAEDGSELTAETHWYVATRNTLAAVIALFAAYLVFEFRTLWFRVFPAGFYYAGYAHEGAAWLTVALAMATLVLSLVFHGQVLRDPRLPRLKRLAWLWSAENLLLALAVYHRMQIYVDFNGMTRMRTIGLFGISAVVVGFVLVVWKITRGRDFFWLVQRQLWTLAIAVYLLAITPVDFLVHRYNVGRILRGDLSPSVQISVHPIDSGGMLVLFPLLESEDVAIREGVRGMLAERAGRLEQTARRRDQEGWTSFQLADHLLLDRLRSTQSEWNVFANPAERDAAIARYQEYAYQWY